jgi:hypothetical protein
MLYLRNDAGTVLYPKIGVELQRLDTRGRLGIANDAFRVIYLHRPCIVVASNGGKHAPNNGVPALCVEHGGIGLCHVGMGSNTPYGIKNLRHIRWTSQDNPHPSLRGQDTGKLHQSLPFRWHVIEHKVREHDTKGVVESRQVKAGHDILYTSSDLSRLDFLS